MGTHHTSDLPLFGEMRSYNRGLGITIKYPNSDQHRKRAMITSVGRQLKTL